MAETGRPNIVGDQFALLYDGKLPPVGAAAVARITGISAGTINVWINRGVLPGVTVGVQGRARLFDPSLVIHLAVVSALVRLGYPALAASNMAIEAFQQGPHPREPGVTLIVKGAPPSEQGGLLPRPQAQVVQRAPGTPFDAAIGSDLLESFTVVDLSAIWNRVKNAIEIAAAEAEK